jgi:hypothetical protein
MRRIRPLVLIALLVALPACGGKTDEKARAAGITPADAIAFMSVSLDPSIEQKRNLVEIARRFPDAEVQDDFGEAKDDLLQQMVEDVGLAYEKDVKPWLGSELAVAVLPGAPGSDVPRAAVLVDQDDEEQARAALDKANQRLSSEGRPEVAYRFVDDFVVVAGSAPDTVALLDVFEQEAKEEGGDLAASEAFADVVDQLQGDRLVLGWVDSKEAFELLADSFGGALPTQLPVDGLTPVAFDFHAGRSSLVLEAVGRSTVAGKAGQPALTRSLPEGILGALTMFDLRSGIEQGLSAVLGTGADPLAELEAQTGVDVEADLLSWMGGELVITASPGAGGNPMPELALVVEPTDRAQAEAGVAKVAQALERGTGAPLERRTVAGATAYVSPPTEQGMQPAMALFEDRFVLASTPAYLERLAGPADDTVAGTDAYQSVLGEASSGDTRFQLYFDLDAVREVLERMLLPDDAESRAEYEAEVRPNLEPLDALGFVLRRDGDYERAELKLTFD